ncbi:MAG: hypothetical protein ABH811_01110 [archaeon]
MAYEKSTYITIKENPKFNESFKLSLEEISNLKEDNFFESHEKINRLIKNSIPNFYSKYRIGGGTNLRINGTNYPFPVLTAKKDNSQFFPECQEYEDNIIINYHILTFE